MIGKNYYRLTNDVILMLGEITSNVSRYIVSNTNKQFVIADVLNTIDSGADSGIVKSTPNIDTIIDYGDTIKCRFLIRQNYKLPAVGFNLNMMRINHEDETTQCLSILLLSNDFNISEVVYVDNNMFHSVVEFDLPREFTRDTSTLFLLDTEFLYDYGESRIITYQSMIESTADELVNFEFLLGNDTSIGNIENYITLLPNGFVEVGIKSLDDSKTLEGTIYAQLSLTQKPAITVSHNIMYGFTNNPDATVNDIVIIRDVEIANKNSLVPVEYKPVMVTDYNPESVFAILYMIVESTIVVGDIHFTRYNEAKFDYADFFPIYNDVTVHNIDVVNNYEQTQNVIVEKEIINPVVIQQPIGFNLASETNEYSISATGFMGIPLSSYDGVSTFVCKIKILEDNITEDLFGMVSSDHSTVMFDLSKAKNNLSTPLEAKKTITYTIIQSSDTFGNIVINSGKFII